MKANCKIMRRALDKKICVFKKNISVGIPKQGWIRTIREALAMTTTQLAKKLGVSQARVVYLEKNESNLKLSTLNKIAQALNCDFAYYIIPRENIENIVSNQAQKKAEKLMQSVNKNMAMENQLVDGKELLEDLKNDLLNKNISRIWDEE
jgi:predicted DNA-binding mobile mystery protein A